MTKDQQERFQEQINSLLNSGIIGDTERNTMSGILNDIEAIILTKRPESDEDAGVVYEKYKQLISAYGKNVGTLRYNLPLGLDEFKFFKNSVKRSITYARDEMFVVKRVLDEFIALHDTKKPEELATVQVSIEMTTWISFLLGKLELVGVPDYFNTFLTLQERLNKNSQIFEYYNRSGEELAERAKNWVQGVSTEEVESEDVA